MIPLFKLEVPSNAGAFFNYLMQIAAFDIIPTDNLFNFLFDVEPPEPLNSNFEVVGFETLYFLHNLGSLCFPIFAFPILVVVNLVLKIYRGNKKFANASRKIEGHIYWNTTIRVLLEAYTIMIVCAFINTTALEFTSYGTVIMSCSACFFLAVCTVLPFFQFFYLNKNFHRLEDHEFEHRVGSLYEGMRLDTKKMLYYNFWFLFRRLMLGYLVVYAREILFFQISGLVAQVVVAAIIAGQIEPFNNVKSNKMEFFNEMMIMMVMYNMICFTDF